MLYVSVNSKHYHPLRQIFKNRLFLQPRANFLCQIKGGEATLGPLILLNFTLFHRIQDLNHLIKLPIEYVHTFVAEHRFINKKYVKS